jgi:alkanesulfonate monooxygenase SsuD/methylene tetrahydromethanopterin reductase-like flavin-dependent oxidoreductase (luciferase family)
VRVGMSVGYWGAGPPEGAAEMVARADELGLDSVWTAEAYGSDALTPLAW